MSRRIIRKKVFDDKPVLKNIIDDHGQESIFEYASSVVNEQINVSEDLKNEFLGVVEAKILELFDKKTAEEARVELWNQYYVSTADHHGPLTHAFFFNSTWLQALVNNHKNNKYIFTLACSGVSLNNSSFPRGFLVHDSNLDEKRLHLFSLKNKHQPIHITKGYDKSAVANVIKEIIAEDLGYKSNRLLKILNKTFFREDNLLCEKYSDQISRGNYHLWKLFPGQENSNLIYLDQEEIVKNLILQHHLNKKTAIFELMFNKKTLSSFRKNFNGIAGAFFEAENKGTFLFWGLKNGKRVRLFLEDEKLISNDYNLNIPLTPNGVAEALNNNQIMPSMALTYIVISFYYGVTCGGGFSQVNYLAELKAAWKKVLLENNFIIPPFLAALQTNHFAADMALSFINYQSRSVPATGLDVLLYGNENNAADFKKICLLTSLKKAVDTMLPEYYKIITGKTSNVKRKKLKPFLFIPSNFSNLFAPKKCEYCGNNPVPHNVQWISESMIIMMSPLNRSMARVGIFRAFSRLLDNFFMLWWRIFEKLKLVGFHNNRETWTIERAKVLWEEAEKKGIEMRGAKIFGREVDFYDAKIGDKVMYFSGLPRPDKFKDTEIEFWLDDKAIIKKKLMSAGVPVSPGGGYSKYKKLLNRFRELEKPVIIKPRLGSRGRHTTTHIYNEEQLRKAFKIAKQLCHWVVMEEHLIGDVFRGTVIGGKLAGVLGGSPPRIIGDGTHTISELIELKNAAKDPRVKDFKISQSSNEFLARNGFNLKTVLPKDKKIDLTEKVGISYGGSSFEITEETHPEIKAALEKAAAAIGDPLLGFDFIVDDVTVSPAGKKWGIIECNGMPFINLHHHPLIGKPNPVARFIWELHE